MKTKSLHLPAIISGSVLALSLGLASSAEAAFIASVSGNNDCPNTYGTGGFETCVYEGSPIIIKFDADGSVDEFNSIFETIDGTEFQFSFIYNDEDEVVSGVWWYTPDDLPDAEDETVAFDPLITYYMAKGGGGWNIFSANNTICELEDAESGSAAQCGSFFVQPFGTLSHLSFYDSLEPGGGGGGAAPEPGILFLMGAGLLGLGMARRRKSA